MEGFAETLVVQVLTDVSKALDVEIKFVDGPDQKMHPMFNPEALMSKVLALFVTAGVNMEVNFQPSYLRVHADIAYWQNRIAELEKSAPQQETPAEAPKEDAPLAT